MYYVFLGSVDSDTLVRMNLILGFFSISERLEQRNIIHFSPTTIPLTPSSYRMTYTSRTLYHPHVINKDRSDRGGTKVGESGLHFR